MSYNAYITELKDVRKHGNADRLQVGTCLGSQVIVSLEMKEGDLGVYFPSDGQLSLEYCEKNNLLRKKDENGKEIGGFLDPDKRHIRPLKLRGEISDGLFMPLTSLDFLTDTSKFKKGDALDILNGVELCRKYVPVTQNTKRGVSGVGATKGKKKMNLFPTFTEHIDTSQLAYNLHSFKEGDICYITLKMHGTSGRSGYLQKVVTEPYKGIRKSIAKLLRKPTAKVQRFYDYVCGTRRVVLASYDGGFYNNDDFRQAHHESFKGKLLKGETVYYEIVGFHAPNSPIMGRVSNKKTQDKEFVEMYGEQTTYHYGCDEAKGESKVYIYRMTMTNEDGFQVEYPWDLIKTRAEQMGIETVLELDRFIYTTEEDMMERVNRFYEGADPIGKTHIREGVVVRVEGKSRFRALKHKGFTFKLLEGIIKDSGVVDMEEAESQEENNNE